MLHSKTIGIQNKFGVFQLAVIWMMCRIWVDAQIMDEFIMENQWEQVMCIFMHKNAGLQSVILGERHPPQAYSQPLDGTASTLAISLHNVPFSTKCIINWSACITPATYFGRHDHTQPNMPYPKLQ